MGSGAWSHESFASYSRAKGKTVRDDGTIADQKYTARSLDPKLDPHGVIRECCNSKEHPTTVPVILALDVTGSMGAACQKTAEALLERCREFYQNPENERAFLEWKAGKDKKC